jgi:polysaccharide pyruvyl transferase CsaB
VPTVLAAGAFGQRNPGDEALLSALLAGLPGWRVIATSADPRTTAAAHGCQAIKARNPAAIARAVSRSDAVVVAGGTVFKSLNPGTRRGRSALLRNALALIAAARAMGKPRAMIGVGADSLSTPLARRLAREIVRHADLTILRDEDSARCLADAGVPPPFRIGADPVWTLLDKPPRSPRDAGAVVVALSCPAGGSELDELLVAALRGVTEAGIPVHVQPWQVNGGREDDLERARSLVGRLGANAALIPAPGSLADAREVFGRYRAVVGLRFHSLVAAASAEVPFVAIAHEPKLAALARRMHQADVSSRDDPSQLAAAVLDAIGGPTPSQAAVRGEIARAEEGQRLLRLLLSRGRSPDANDVTGLPLWPADWVQ